MLGALERDAAGGLYGDGIVTGFGTIEGRKVCVFSQDPTVHSGTFGRIHRLKMTNIMDRARRLGVPMVCLWDGAGGRLERSTYVDPASYSTFRRFIDSSGVIPQISAILGATAGNASYGPALTDFVFFVSGQSFAFATGPRGTKEEIGESIGMEELGGAEVHCRRSGLGDRRFDSEDACFAAMRKLLGYLPPNSGRKPPRAAPADEPPAVNEALGKLVPADGRKPYDMLGVIRELVDGRDFFEIKPEFAANVITGFGRLGGRSVGIVANQPLVMTGALTIDASVKAARFVRFLDCFNIPVVLLVDTTGYMPGSEQEHERPTAGPSPPWASTRTLAWTSCMPGPSPNRP
jgi:acetyl-CoA carboxylase carboxyltransferase component